jgi:hypothetical protein
MDSQPNKGAVHSVVLRERRLPGVVVVRLRCTLRPLLVACVLTGRGELPGVDLAG